MTTKLELSQLLAQRNTELEAARLRISILEGELALRPRTQVTPARAAYLARRAEADAPREPTAFQRACAAAKAAALAGHKAVRVEVAA